MKSIEHQIACLLHTPPIKLRYKELTKKHVACHHIMNMLLCKISELCMNTNGYSGQILNNLRKRLRLPRVIVYYDIDKKASKSCARPLPCTIYGRGAAEGEAAIDCDLFGQ